MADGADPSDRLDADYRPPTFTIEAVELVLELAVPQTRVASRLRFRRLDPSARDLVLDGVGLRLLSAALDGVVLEPSRLSVSADRLVVHDAPDAGELSLAVLVQPGGPGMEGLIDLDGVLVTHCEPEGFRRITYFIDRPDVMALYRATLIADPARWPTLLCNGEPVAEASLPDGRRSVTWADDLPKASYLFALAAGRFATLTDSFTTRSGRVVPLTVHADEAGIGACAHGLATLKAAMAWDEATFGAEYGRDRFNIVVMRNYPGGAMENPGLNLYASEFFQADPTLCTDAELRRITASVAHEYFHEWSGNRVGCRSWLDLTVKEGLTVLRQQRFMADLVGPDARIDDVVFLRASQYPEDDGELAHPIRPADAGVASNLYTRTVYEKGAEVMRMLSLWIGEDAFDRVVRAWFARFDGQPASVEDFLQLATAVSGVDLAPFRAWWRVAGAVELAVEVGAPEPGGGRALRLSQRTARPQPKPLEALPIPLRLGFVTAEPPAGSMEPPLLRLEAPSTEVRLTGVAPDAVASLLRGHSAAVRLSVTQTPGDLALLARFDPDPVARWEAGQALVRAAAGAWAAEAGTGVAAAAWLDLAEALLVDAPNDPGAVGRILTLPPEASLGLGQAIVDVDGLADARRGLETAAGRRLAARLAGLHATLAAVAWEPAGVGARRLRNLALGWRARAGDPQAAELALRQLAEAPTMEDQAAALRILVELGGAAREAGRDLARRRWEDDARRLDNWFAVQGASTAPDVASQVEGLLQDPGFDLKQATRVKALLDAFAGNQGGFHAAGGLGYRTLGAAVARLGARNPRLASRFLKPFASLRRFDPTRREAMADVLRDLEAQADLASEPRARLRAILALEPN